MKSIMKSSLSSLMSAFLIVAVLCLSASQVSAQRRSKDSRKDTPAAGAIAKDGNTPAKDGQTPAKDGQAYSARKIVPRMNCCEIGPWRSIAFA